MDDIVPSLLESIQKDFSDRLKKNKTVAKTWGKIKTKTATYEDANDFAVAVGEMLEQSYKQYISADSLPEGRMWYNIATRILEPTLHNNYDLISQVCEEAQTTVNEQSGIGLKAIKPTYNTERVNGFIDKISNAEDFDDVAWLLGDPVVNYSQSVVDDSIQQNADFHAASGITPKIRRILAPSERRTTMSGHKKATYYVPCPWCAALAGEYNYPNVPRDVFRRHENCRCTLEYVVGGKKQNPWYTKKTWEDDRQERIEELKTVESEEEKYAEKLRKFNQENAELPFIVDEALNGDEYHDEMVIRTRDYLKTLAEKYHTHLKKVSFGQNVKGSAGSVDMAGNMALVHTDVGVVTHEFAHTIASIQRDDLGITDDSEFWKELKRLRTQHRKAAEKNRNLIFSDYAMTGGGGWNSKYNMDEYMAEGFAIAYTYLNGLMKDMRHRYITVPMESMEWAIKVYDLVNKYFAK